MQNIQAVRGMHDIIPPETMVWQRLEDTIRAWIRRYGYQEIRFPIVEQTALFVRTVGEHTDIVEKETYTFDDRNGDSLTLRPEGTAGCVRAVLEHNLLQQANQRLWYMGPMFRHERPQKGRARQFHQLGVEALGFANPELDCEIISMAAQLWQDLGIASHLRLEINSLGTASTRTEYRSALVAYLTKHADILDEDSQRRLTTNPLRVLDSKNPALKTVIQNAPSMLDFLDDEARQHFETLQRYLTALHIPFKINSRLVRGLDYYTKTVFEWVTDDLGAQGTVCAGGRYDGLVAHLGGPATPAVGMAMGLERLVLLYQNILSAEAKDVAAADVCLIAIGDEPVLMALQWAARLRAALPTLRILCHAGEGGFKQQFKRADKSGAQFAVIFGDEEISQKSVSIKNLKTVTQEICTFDNMINFLTSNI